LVTSALVSIAAPLLLLLPEVVPNELLLVPADLRHLTNSLIRALGEAPVELLLLVGVPPRVVVEPPLLLRWAKTEALRLPAVTSAIAIVIAMIVNAIVALFVYIRSDRD
jgi:hypothetical protein